MIAQLPSLRRITREHPLTGRCLNAGCGEGLYCGFLEGFPGVTAIENVDLDGTPRRLAGLTDPRHAARDASLTDLPFDDATFDSCLCTEVLEHIPDDDRAVRELSRCLRPGGTLLVSVPHPPAPHDPNHVREGYTLGEMSRLLDRHGLGVVASGRCFSTWLAGLLRLWRWQHRALGGSRTNFMPAFLVRAFGYADLLLPIGPRWDLVVLAVKR
ncbi:class I SAM-dependent methyltransferase (plasmid) [Tundrisphaera sp. TA3]|uniref:class I SAM-dependent methyltransferase n=1 Tax=Tundrisphaera sp. TA3 TaxID=3435775 RepID=UPI003EB9D01D